MMYVQLYSMQSDELHNHYYLLSTPLQPSVTTSDSDDLHHQHDPQGLHWMGHSLQSVPVHLYPPSDKFQEPSHGAFFPHRQFKTLTVHSVLDHQPSLIAK